MGDTDFKGKVLKAASTSSALANEVVLENFSLSERFIDGRPFGVVAADLSVKRSMDNITLNFGISNHHGIVVCAFDGARGGFMIPRIQSEDKLRVEMVFRKHLLPGRYYISCLVHELIGDISRPQCLCQNIVTFEITGSDSMSGIANLNMSVRINEQSSRAVSENVI
jgi:hypothetical protein